MKLNGPDIRDLTNSYIDLLESYADYAATVASIIKSILERKGIPYQAISHRAKSVDSLREKIKRKKVQGTIYKHLDDVPDLAGVRVILYFKDDVEPVLKIVEEEFDVLHKKVKPPQVKLQRGYTAFHRIVKLNHKRTSLDEYTRYTQLAAEVQIKTVLQHAWAEIEHDIGYKPKLTEQDLARNNIRELFVANAKLIEEVDNNFVEIRSLHRELLSKYQDEIDMKNLAIAINYDTVSSFLKKRYQGKSIRKQQVLDILVQAEKRNLANLSALSESLDDKSIAFSYQD